MPPPFISSILLFRVPEENIFKKGRKSIDIRRRLLAPLALPLLDLVAHSS
jgi:hypothetical protein